MLRVISIILLFAGSWAHGQDLGSSAYRAPGSSYLGYKSVATVFSTQGDQEHPVVTPLDVARADSLATLPKATEWPSEVVMNEHFEKFRDFRFITEPEMPTFLRRSSWMYPDDGCFARAALAIRNLLQWSITAPKKVFAVGDLTVKSANAVGGSVTWWYHVAPLVEVAGQKYVLDPALEPLHPLKLEDWLAKMSEHPETIEVSVCESGTYTPGDDCAKASDGIEDTAMTDQVYYLEQEWQRLLDLSRNPNEELGEHPPWLH